MSGRSGTRTMVALALLMGLFAAACGSGSSDGKGDAASAMSTTSMVGAEETSTTVAADLGPTTVPRATTGGGGTTSGTGGTGAPKATAAKLPVGAGVHGVTDDTITVGVMTADAGGNAITAGALTGANVSQAQSSPHDKLRKSIVDYLNAHGGIAGRKLVVKLYYSDIANTLSPSGRQRDQQGGCAFFTEDQKVFAILGEQQTTENLWFDCITHTKTPFIGNTTGNHPYPTERQAELTKDYFFVPGGLDATRRERAIVPFMVQNGFMDKSSKVAVMIDGSPGTKEAAEKALKPALVAAGIKPVVEIVYPDAVASPWSTYVLQMQSKGVTHVLFSASTGSYQPIFFMMQAASGQQYKPKWGVGSEQCMLCLTALKAPVSQLVNTFGMGIAPYIDVAAASTPQSDSAKLCTKIEKDAGLTPLSASGIECEMYFFLQAALSKADELSAAGLSRGTEALGTSFKGMYAIGGATKFGPGRHYGATVARYFAYDGTCSCFKYTSPAYSIP